MRTIIPAVFVTALCVTGSVLARPNAADRTFRQISSAEWQWRQQQLADDEDGQLPIMDHLPKVDPASQAERQRHWEEVIRQLDAIKRSDLSPPEQLNLDIYHRQIEGLITSQRFRDFEMPANSDTAFWTDLGYTARRPFKTLQDYKNWIAQMRDIPRYFHEQMDEMRAGLKRGFTPPRVTMEGRDASITNVTGAAPEATLFYTPFKEMPGISAADRDTLRAEAVRTIREVVQPAYAELLQFMRTEYVPGTRTTLAAIDLPDGEAYYRAKIRDFTTLDL